jgi:DNA (cytosine-5)-methyltransferase 3A
MNVLSLFDGVSAGQIALLRAGVKVDNYFASEIDKKAIDVTQHNFPNTIQLGDVRQLNKNMLPKIDLLIGGSPCQGFSVSGKMLGFLDERSALFFEYVRLLNELKPNYFLLENVKMRESDLQVITDVLGVNPITLNSSLVSAQNRIRNYWMNFPIKEIADVGIELDSVLEYPGKSAIVSNRKTKDGNNQTLIVTGRKKSNTITASGTYKIGVSNLPIGNYANYFLRKNELDFRPFSTIEMARLQTFPDNYFDAVSKNAARALIGNSWTVDLISRFF